MNTSNKVNKLVKVLAIGGSDPSGGAGIQADIKTLMRQGVYGLSVLTAVTAQNTIGVSEIYSLPPKIIAGQITTLVHDFDIMAVKIGMLTEVGTVETVASELKRYHLPKIVLDPIIYAHTGKGLLSVDALKVLIKILLPLAKIITPNIIEAEALTKSRINNIEDMKTAALRIGAMGVKNVFLKGGHIGDGATDILFSDGDINILRGEPVNDRQVHGTGCLISSVIAAELGKGSQIFAAVRKAKKTINSVIKNSIKIGRGHNVADWERI